MQTFKMRVFLVCIAIATQIFFAVAQDIQQIGLSNEQRTRSQTTKTVSSSTTTTRRVQSSQTQTRSVSSPFSSLASTIQNAGSLTTSTDSASGSIQALANLNTGILGAPAANAVSPIAVSAEEFALTETQNPIRSSAAAAASAVSNPEAIAYATPSSPATLQARSASLVSPTAKSNSPLLTSSNLEVTASAISNVQDTTFPTAQSPARVPTVSPNTVVPNIQNTAFTKAQASSILTAPSQLLVSPDTNVNSEPLTNPNAKTPVTTYFSAPEETMRGPNKRLPNLVTFGGPKSTNYGPTTSEPTGITSKQWSKSAKTTSTVSQVATARTPEAYAEGPIALPTYFTELKETHMRIKTDLQLQTAQINKIKSLLPEQINNWYFKSPELQLEFEEAQAAMTKLNELSNAYTLGGEKLLQALEGSTLQPEWIDQLKKLQNLASTALSRSANIMEVLRRLSDEVLEDHKAYKEAKAQQTAETKVEMENELNELLQQTLQVGQQASKVIMQAKNEWGNILRQNLGSAKATSAIARINDITASIQADLEHLTPEDIETAMNDAHRCIEDIKGLFHSYNIPVVAIRQSVNPVQLAVFSIITKGKNIHTQSITNLK